MASTHAAQKRINLRATNPDVIVPRTVHSNPIAWEMMDAICEVSLPLSKNATGYETPYTRKTNTT